MVGKTLGHYEIIEPLGKGGMGEVYRARDTKLERDVAVKVLPEDFATDRERLARFEREAKLLASLNHSNIAAIYGLEDEGDQRFIAMELVEGETLAERIARSGRITPGETLLLARQVAEALEAAHANGVVHRDLKPANVMVTADGSVKVLDFGLAKSYGDDAPSQDISQSPTIAVATGTGVIMGTAAYMSPEQAKGRPLDKRTDIWSFGCLVYEMLAGRSPFQAEDVSETLASILKEEPDWTALPAGTPRGATAAVRRCLVKDPNLRLHDIADARIEITEASIAPDEPLPAHGRTGIPWQAAGALAVIVGLVSAVAVWVMAPSTLAPAEPEHFREVLPEGVDFPPPRNGERSFLAVSANRDIVFIAENDGAQQLYLSRRDGFNVGPIPGTEDARRPFFSPDGTELGFFKDGHLFSVSLRDDGEVPIAVCRDCAAPDALGAWSPIEPMIVFSSGGSLWRVRVGGGSRAEPIEAATEGYYRGPNFLPGGTAVLVHVSSPAIENGVVAFDLLSEELTPLGIAGRFPVYVNSGHVITQRGAGIFTVAFDHGSRQTTGEPVQILPDVRPRAGTGNGTAHFAIGPDGTLAYVPFARPERSLVWVDMDGAPEPAVESRGIFTAPTISPDGRSAAVGADGNRVFLLDIDGGSFRPLNVAGESGRYPTFRDDGHVTYADDEWNLVERRTDLSDQGEEATYLHSAPGFPYAEDWTNDGNTLLYRAAPTTPEPGRGGSESIFSVTISGDGVPSDPRPVRDTAFNERGARLSPNGDWLAYVSNSDGDDRVYVVAFPDPGSVYPISGPGGRSPIWDPAGDAIYYRGDGFLMKAELEFDAGVSVASPARLFPDDDYYPSFNRQFYDIHPDGDRFLFVAAPPSPRHINVVLNWFEELKRQVPTGSGR